MISIIVPVYRVEPFLRQCLDSLVGQTYRDLEIILVDDASPDRCGEICEEYAEEDGRIRVFHFEENRGLSAARNKGLDEAKGEYIGFVDSDDWVEPDMYETLLRAMEENGADIVSCGVWNKPGHEKKRSPHRITPEFSAESNEYIGHEDILRAMLHGRIIVYSWNKLYRTELFNRVRFPEGRCFEDAACMHLILEKARKAVVLSKRGYHYRIRQNSISKTYTAKNLMDLTESSLSRYYWFAEHYPDLFQENRSDLLKFVAKATGRVWRWWYGCSSEEKVRYRDRIEELKSFTKKNLTSDMIKEYPFYLRLSVWFMKRSSNAAFGVFYIVNQIYGKLRGRL